MQTPKYNHPIPKNTCRETCQPFLCGSSALSVWHFGPFCVALRPFLCGTLTFWPWQLPLFLDFICDNLPTEDHGRRTTQGNLGGWCILKQWYWVVVSLDWWLLDILMYFVKCFFKLIMTVFIYSFAYLFICLRYARCLSLSIVYLCLEHVETFANPQSCFEQ